MTLSHKNFNNKKPNVIITLNKVLQLHLYEQDQTFSKYVKECLLWLRIVSLWLMIEKLSLCQLFFCRFLKMKKIDLRLFCFKAAICNTETVFYCLILKKRNGVIGAKKL